MRNWVSWCFLAISGLSLVAAIPPPQPSSSTPPPLGNIWAFLVAGSSGYYNYRHQADICHAYQVLHNNGVPDERIVVMMADDIAYNEQNPKKGVIINHPGGSDVYKGVPKDYTGKNVNVENFLNILSGNKNAMKGIGSGRVIESGPDDIVFVNFVDHGSPGVLCFDDELLHADDLNHTLSQMKKKGKFSKLFMYVEACHAGSMFDAYLSDEMNIFAMAASDPFESSYACYYDDELQTFLGDVFSVSWLYDAENEPMYKSIHHMFEKVRTMTNTSHVEEYGDLNMGEFYLGEILGESTASVRHNSLYYKPMESISNEDVVASVDVPLEILNRKLMKENNTAIKNIIQLERDYVVKGRGAVDKMMKKLVSSITEGDARKRQIIETGKFKLGTNNFPCYKQAVAAYSEHCFSFPKNPYVGKHLMKLVNLCAVEWFSPEEIISAIRQTCNNHPFRGLPTIY